uniref:Uncharacterized protein n=1 Tax=Arundo donax TaxID=35708 RepID=A0A0A8YYP0_ARUDO
MFLMAAAAASLLGNRAIHM